MAHTCQSLFSGAVQIVQQYTDVPYDGAIQKRYGQNSQNANPDDEDVSIFRYQVGGLPFCV